jgi:hypothetical protein
MKPNSDKSPNNRSFTVPSIHPFLDYVYFSASSPQNIFSLSCRNLLLLYLRNTRTYTQITIILILIKRKTKQIENLSIIYYSFHYRIFFFRTALLKLVFIIIIIIIIIIIVTIFSKLSLKPFFLVLVFLVCLSFYDFSHGYHWTFL